MKTLITAAALSMAMSVSAAATTTILDIDGKTNVGSTNANHIELDLLAGDYTVTPFSGTYEAFSVWGANFGCDGLGENCTRGYFVRYNFTDIGGNNLFSYSSGPNGLFATTSQALQSALDDGPQTFTLAADTKVFVGIFDSPVSDNRGGVSLQLSTAAVPVPASLPLLAGAIGFLAMRRSRKA